MGIAYNPRTVTDGLILYYDPSNSKSYAGSGTTLFDISKTRNNGILNNGPSFSTATSTQPGYFTMDGTDDYLSASIPVGTSMTFEIVYKLFNPSTGWGPLWRESPDGWRERLFPSNLLLIPTSGSYYYINGPENSTNLQNFCYTYQNAEAKTYRNGSLVSAITMDSSMTTLTANYRFGNQAGGSSFVYINMNLYSLKVYNRALSGLEIKQNFNATRRRFAL